MKFPLGTLDQIQRIRKVCLETMPLLLPIFLILILIMIIIKIMILDVAEKPFKLTYVFLLAVFIQWMLYLSGVYASLPESVSDRLWDVLWSGIICMGVLVAVLEFKKSMLLSVLLASFTGVQLMYFLFTLSISQM